MKLVVAVIHDRDQKRTTDALRHAGFRFTKIGSTGGFLREGNTTLMIGVDDERLPELKKLIQHTCRTRTRLVAANVPVGEQNEGVAADPVEVPVGGAVLFVMQVAEFVKM